MWYHCTICHHEDPQRLSEGMKGVIIYTRLNTSSVCNHVMSTHPREHKALTSFYDENMRHEREETLMGQGSSQLKLKVEDSDSYISRVSDFMIATKKYNKCHTHQASFEENIVDLVAKAFTPLSLVDCREFRKLISSLDPRIVTFSRSRLSRKFIPLKYEDVEYDVMKELNNGPYVILSFDLWISVKNEDIFSISAHH